MKQALVALSMAIVSQPAFAAEAKAPQAPDFSRSFQIWTQGSEWPCLYNMGDIFVRRELLDRSLTSVIHKEYGVELLTSSDTTAACVADAATAVKKAGFTLFRARLATEEDKRSFVPPADLLKSEKVAPAK